MESTKPNEPITPHETWGNSATYGLTKREYFAGLAMQGLLADPNTGNAPDAANAAVKYADALIAALNGDDVAASRIDVFAADEAIKLGRKLGYIIGDDWTEWEAFMAVLFKGKRCTLDLTTSEQSQWLSTLRAMERACRHQESLKEGTAS